MKIKTRESLKTIKTFDRADTIAQKSKNGVSSFHNSAEQTQGVGYESETEYAGNELQDKEKRIARTAVMGADLVDRWGVRETRKNIQNWRNRPRKPKPNPKLKQLPSPQRKALQAPKKGIKAASKGTKTAAKGAKTTAKASKAAVKTSVKAVQALKNAAVATVKFIKVVAKAIVAAVKATVATLKGIVAAIATGGWIAVLIIVIIVLVGLVVDSAYAIFVPAEDSEITIYSVINDLEREYHQKQSELIANCQYDILNYEGDIAAWNEMIAVYAVKLNLGDEPQEVVTFDENKADELRSVFWDMNLVRLETESVINYVPKQEIDEDGNIREITEAVTKVYLTVISDSIDAFEVAENYEFNVWQEEMLADLLDEKNAELWTGLLGTS